MSPFLFVCFWRLELALNSHNFPLQTLVSATNSGSEVADLFPFKEVNSVAEVKHCVEGAIGTLQRRQEVNRTEEVAGSRVRVEGFYILLFFTWGNVALRRMAHHMQEVVCVNDDLLTPTTTDYEQRAHYLWTLSLFLSFSFCKELNLAVTLLMWCQDFVLEFFSMFSAADVTLGSVLTWPVDGGTEGCCSTKSLAPVYL